MKGTPSVFFAIIKVQLPKVQLPVVEGPPEVYIYSEGRQHKTLQPLTPELKAKLNGRYKAYFHGTWDAKSGWVVGEPVEDQPW